MKWISDQAHEEERRDITDPDSLCEMDCQDGFGFVDKATYPARRFAGADGAVVVPGSRTVTRCKGADWGLSTAAPIIVKYRDEKTELSLVLEDVLR